MKNEAKAAHGGALSVDQAVAKLSEVPKKKKGEDAALRQAQGEEGGDDAMDQTQDNESDDDVPQGGTDEEGDPRQAQDEDEDAEDAELEPPQFWDAEAKERFADLPRDLQKVVLDKENERNQATAKALQEAASHRKQADQQAARFKTVSDGLDTLLPHAFHSFQGRWSNVDWQRVAQSHGPAHALKLQHQMQAEQRQLQQLSAAKELTDRLSHMRFVQEQEALMPKHAPELADPKQGTARREELGRFLQGLGVAPNRMSHLSALETGLAYDAMQWRNAKAKADALVKAPRETQPQKRLPAKPGGQAPRGSTQQNRIAHLSKKRELSIDEAVELHNLKGLP